MFTENLLYNLRLTCEDETLKNSIKINTISASQNLKTIITYYDYCICKFSITADLLFWTELKPIKPMIYMNLKFVLLIALLI